MPKLYLWYLQGVVRRNAMSSASELWLCYLPINQHADCEKTGRSVRVVTQMLVYGEISYGTKIALLAFE